MGCKNPYLKQNKMKTISTTVVSINGQFDIYANETTQRTQNYADLALEQGKDYSAMSKSAKLNFRKRNQGKCKVVEETIEVFKITATIPNIFSEFQLKEATIHHLIFPASQTIFLKCKNGKTGYSTGNFKINKKINE